MMQTPLLAQPRYQPNVRDSTSAALVDTTPLTRISTSAVPPSWVTAQGYATELFELRKFDTLGGTHQFVHGKWTARSDTIGRHIDSLMQLQLQGLQQSSVAPRSLIGMAVLYLQLGRDAAAQECVERWLKTPGMSRQDTLATLGMIMGFFTDRDEMTDARLGIMRGYMARLEAYPRQIAHSTIALGYLRMFQAFRQMGYADSAVAAGFRSFALLPDASYEERGWTVIGPDIVDFAIVLSGQPNGVARLDSLMTVFKSYIPVPPDLLAKDTALARLAKIFQDGMTDLDGKVRWLGRPLAPVVATHWFNHPQPRQVSDAAPNARILPVNDGIIRIIGFGDFHCPACHLAMRYMQHDQKRLPKNVQTIYYEWTLGACGTDFCEPEEEVDKYRKIYVVGRHYTFPIVIWAGPKDSTPGGGLLPRESPTKQALHIAAMPTIYVLDGRGVVRYMQFGYGGYSDEIQRAVEQLIREREHGNMPLPLPPAAPVPLTVSANDLSLPLRPSIPTSATSTATASTVILSEPIRLQ